MSDQDDQDNQSNPYDTWVQHPAIGVSADSFADPSAATISDDGTITMPPDTITANPPQDGSDDSVQPWTFNPIDPSKSPPSGIDLPPGLNLPPYAKYGRPDDPPPLPDWMWADLDKLKSLPKPDTTPEWKKWQKAVKDWCEDHHVDPGPIIDIAKDKLKDAIGADDDGKDDGFQPSRKDGDGGPPTDDDD